MGYIKTNWLDRAVEFVRRYRDQNNNLYDFTPEEGTIFEEGTFVNALNMNNIETGIQQNNLFEMLLTNDRYKDYKFDIPAVGNITEEIRLKSDNSLYASYLTEFDVPNVGDITTTLTCTDLGISNKVITAFNPAVGVDIRETSSEVV